MAESKSPLADPEAWNLVSEGYVTDVVPQFEAFARDALRLAGVTAGMRVVDVACGPGTLSFLAAAEGARVSALDFSERMIEALNDRARREGAQGIEARTGNGMALPYGASEFDAGFSMFGLMFFPDRQKGFKELVRVLKPGARAVVSSWQPMDRVPLFAELFATLRALMPDLPFGEGPPPLGTAEEMSAEMLASGFQKADVHEIAHTIEAASLSAWLESMLRSMAPLVLLQHRMGPSAFEPLARTLYDRLAQRFGNGPQSMRLVSNFGVGVR
ncbi:MAG TPA: methyltransferase domain-containing protein [Polyangiaceae bacterium]|nr:methyltransferase domain-containing protein [Polyangiaceae bacterium]